MRVGSSEEAALYEARREAAPAVVIAALLLAILAFVSWEEGWELVRVRWWVWILLTVPGLLLTADLWLGSRGAGLARTRRSQVILLGVIVGGNLVGVVLLVAALVTTPSAELGGGQLLLTVAAIWLANVIVFGMFYWELDDSGPFARATQERVHPDFQFPQDENPSLAREGWRPRMWDYLYVSLTAGTAFSPTDAMPLTLSAKLLMAIESTVSLVLVVLVTARAVNILG